MSGWEWAVPSAFAVAVLFPRSIASAGAAPAADPGFAVFLASGAPGT